MKPLQSRFETVEKHINEKNITVMIIGLGSVGTYLLDYLVSRNDEALKVLVEVLQSEDISKFINDTYDGAVVPLN